VLLRQFVDDDLGCASYLIADEQSGDAVLVDPAYAIEPYLLEAERRSLRICCVLETHTHADHVSGHGRLALDYDIPVSVHEAAEAKYEHRALRDGDEIPVGSLRVQVIHSPGHRPEHCCFLADDALLTGDSLFVRAAARPDLAVEAREGAEGLFHSLQRLLELDDGVRVFPGHLAGSLCGTHMSADPSSTIGDERRFNPALALATVEEFVDASASVSSPRPPNMERIVELNRGPLLGTLPPVETVEMADGATILDVRAPEAHAAGHVRGALNVPVAHGGFGTSAGFVLRPDERVVLHASSHEEAELAVQRLRAVGFLQIAGVLANPAPSEATQPVALDELDDLLAAQSVDVLDVRELDERDGGYIAGTRHIPYRLLRVYGQSVANGKTIVTICESGTRAAIAASVLAAAGVDARPVLHGGIDDWRRRGGHTIEFRRCGSNG
jgi:glyoxylase-like metal-dependent hydrolase (beta-lactamase superfamily II)/rhodanese-related sulfurtransferase